MTHARERISATLASGLLLMIGGEAAGETDAATERFERAVVRILRAEANGSPPEFVRGGVRAAWGFDNEEDEEPGARFFDEEWDVEFFSESPGRDVLVFEFAGRTFDFAFDETPDPPLWARDRGAIEPERTWRRGERGTDPFARWESDATRLDEWFEDVEDDAWPGR